MNRAAFARDLMDAAAEVLKRSGHSAAAQNLVWMPAPVLVDIVGIMRRTWGGSKHARLTRTAVPADREMRRLADVLLHDLEALAAARKGRAS